MATKVTRRCFSYQTAQQARSWMDAATDAGESVSLAEALRLAEGDHAGADAVRRELEQANR